MKGWVVGQFTVLVWMGGAGKSKGIATDGPQQ